VSASAAAVGVRGSRPWSAAPDGESRQIQESQARDSIALRVVAFAALAAFAAAQWVALVADPPVGRTAIAVAAGVAGAAALSWIARARIGRIPAWTLALLASLLAVVAGAWAMGVPARLLTPWSWGQLHDQLVAGLNAIGNDDYPYRGTNEWSRLAILSGLPLWLGLAAALAFSPGRRAAGSPRIAALVVLVAAYATAVTVNPPPAPLVHGLILLALVAAWLWLPRVERRDARAGGALVLVAGVIALPLAARLDGGHPWFDWRAWNWAWSSIQGGETFTWDQSYGPIDWPRSGKKLLEVKSDAPHYWRTAVLDEFDGFRWLQSVRTAGGGPELPEQAAGTGTAPDLSRLDPAWLHRITFNVHSLRSPLVIGAGTVVAVSGLYGVTPTSSGLILPPDDPLSDGDSYTVRAYVPDPTAEQMAAAPPRYPAALAQYTRIELPQQGSVTVPLWGGERPPAAAADVATARAAASRTLSGSPYAGMYGLAHRLTGGKPTTYGAVNAIEDYLRSNYTYNERPPQHRYPLRAFLFKDGRGYCQQFSGTMALMLRMVGIPSRVAAGFSAGTPNQADHRFVVRDFDAHSWVEVYFNGIGWVAFDPTPAVAPPKSQSSGLGLLNFATITATGKPLPQQGTSGRGHSSKTPRPLPTGSSSAFPLWVVPAGLLGLVLIAGALALIARGIRYRSLSPAAATEARLRELEAAVVRLRSWTVGGATLLGLERRLSSAAAPRAAGYAAKLRAARYAPRDQGQPTAAERRALRRELTSGLGMRARLRGLYAIPPGGPWPA
jgi:protein-glutamine gamma-glutamyltransferase